MLRVDAEGEAAVAERESTIRTFGRGALRGAGEALSKEDASPAPVPPDQLMTRPPATGIVAPVT